MALRPIDAYPANVGTHTFWPYGRARNEVVENDGTATPLEEKWVNDVWGFLQSLLIKGNVTPNGNPDSVGNAQYLQALRKYFSYHRASLQEWRAFTVASEPANAPGPGAYYAGTSASVEARVESASNDFGKIITSIWPNVVLDASAAPFGVQWNMIVAVGDSHPDDANVYLSADGHHWFAPGNGLDGSTDAEGGTGHLLVTGGGSIFQSASGYNVFDLVASGGGGYSYDTLWYSYYGNRLFCELRHATLAGIVSTSDDAGSTWTSRSTGVTNTRPASLASNNAGVCVLACWNSGGATTTLLRSADNGNTWTTVTTVSGQGSVAWSQYHERFMFHGDAGTFRVSADGGLTWTPYTTPFTAAAGLVKVPHGLAAAGPFFAQLMRIPGPGGYLINGVAWTDDVGLTWHIAPFGHPITAGKYPTQIKVWNDNRFIVGSPGVIYTSSPMGLPFERYQPLSWAGTL